MNKKETCKREKARFHKPRYATDQNRKKKTQKLGNSTCS